MAASTRDRTISFYNIHNKETLTVQYMKDGKRIPQAMKEISWILRDWRKDVATVMDPELIDLLWEIHTELGSTQPIHIISGYRSRDTNELLRRTVGGQASQSRHILGKAADVHFPDVPLRKLRYSALIRERGGVGYYPTSAIPFVHVDTDRVRAWPRLPRPELALLFPSGHTQHIPADGVPLTRDDARKARAAEPELAAQVAQFFDQRAHPRPATQVASANARQVASASGPQVASLSGPSLPQLVSLPKLIERPSTFGTRPTDSERARLAALASEPAPKLLTPPSPASRPAAAAGKRLAAADPVGDLIGGRRGRAGSGQRVITDTTFVPAPAYDDEHPEEMSYRPFPIAPLLTLTASADDPALAVMVHPDLSRILELIDQAGSAPPMQLRPGAQTVQLLWAQEFKGDAVDLAAINEVSNAQQPAGLAERKVVTRAP